MKDFSVDNEYETACAFLDMTNSLLPYSLSKEILVERVLYRFDSVQSYSKGLNELLVKLRPGLLARREKYFKKEAKVIALVLNDFKQSNKVNFDDELETAYAMIQATNSLLPYALSTKELGKRKDVKKKAEKIADLLIHGITE